jgi:DNA-binding SARP family transcriptional activator
VSKSNYALRLSVALKKEAERLAKEDGTTLNQFINIAVAEKISALRTAEFFARRGARGDVKKALEILSRAGNDDPPIEGDEILPPVSRRKVRRRA